jgi:hypothetical protein
MKSNVKISEKGAGARLREKLRGIKRDIKPSPDLVEITRERPNPAREIEDEDGQRRRKIAAPKRPEDLDL